MALRIVCISDTHCRHRELNIPDGDILIHAGDITNRGEYGTLEDFNDWLAGLPHKHKVIIPGNHDYCFEKDPAWSSAIMTNCFVLLHETISLAMGKGEDDIKIFGSPYSAWFFDWAFNLPPANTPENIAEIRGKWAQIPPDVDIIVTHGPPRGIMDWVVRDENVGCPYLLDKIIRVSPKLAVFGHIHEQHGEMKHNDIHYVNASSLNDMYRPAYDAVIVDL